MSENVKRPIGTGHASAMLRQGLRELRGAFYPESNIAQPTEHGIWGTLTPGEIAESKRAAEMDQEPGANGKAIEPRPETKVEPQRDDAAKRNDRGMDRD